LRRVTPTPFRCATGLRYVPEILTNSKNLLFLGVPASPRENELSCAWAPI
jgi:hypothetical protein